jgi:hypothetical protein
MILAKNEERRTLNSGNWVKDLINSQFSSEGTCTLKDSPRVGIENWELRID